MVFHETERNATILFHSVVQPGHHGGDVANGRPGNPFLNPEAGWPAVDDQGLPVRPIIEPDPRLTVDHMNDTALIAARPAARLIDQHHTRRRPGSEIIVGKLQSRQRRHPAVDTVTERTPPGLKAGRFRFWWRLHHAPPLEILDRGVKRRCQPTLDIGSEQTGPATGFIEPPPLTGHAHPGTGVGLTQTAVPAKGGKGLAQSTGGRIEFETRHPANMPSSRQCGEDENVSRNAHPGSQRTCSTRITSGT